MMAARKVNNQSGFAGDPGSLIGLSLIGRQPGRYRPANRQAIISIGDKSPLRSKSPRQGF
jgi:hypothetical protein